MMIRKQSFQSLSWFWDHYKRDMLNLEPPYQRKSVWNQEYKDAFVDTVLLGYPCPAVFLYEEISSDGVSKYAVVDGKQRLLTLFDFASDRFSTSGKISVTQLRDKYFKDLSDIQKRDFWRYQFCVEFIPNEDENLIGEIFNRINRNVAKLTRQELRHAKYDGVFITTSEDLTEWMISRLPKNFPMIATQSRKQMKDVELVSEILLRLDGETKSFSQDALDEAYSQRDKEWPERTDVEASFRETIDAVRVLLRADKDGVIVKSRLRNQADFYSLFFALSAHVSGISNPNYATYAKRLNSFIEEVENDAKRRKSKMATEYYGAARSASNDMGPRRTRIKIIRSVLRGQSGTKT